MMNSTIVLYEHQTYPLTWDEAYALEESCRAIWNQRKTSVLYLGAAAEYSDVDSPAQSLIQFSYSHDGRVTIKPGGYIGIISAGMVQYIILPKIFQDVDTDQIACYLDRMFGYAAQIKAAVSMAVASGAEACSAIFAEILINTFANRVCALLSHRQYNAYQEVDENISTVRGRIDFSEHVKRNLTAGRHDRIACTFELYQEDNLLNQIIKYVCRLLIARTRLYENRRILSAALEQLEDVSDRHVDYRSCLRIKLNAYQQEYVPILDYCKMFLSYRMADVASGEYGIDHVVIKTAALYEDFVAGYLREHASNIWRVETKKTGYIATEGGNPLFQFENDLLLVHQEIDCTIIVDAKYKSVELEDRSNKFGVSQGDLYQMISYAVCRGARTVVLVYPGRHEYADTGRVLHINDSRSRLPLTVHICTIPMDIDDQTNDHPPAWLDRLLSEVESIMER